MDLQLEAVDALGEPGEPGTDGGLLGPELRELLRHRGPRRFRGRQVDARLGHRAVDGVEQRRNLGGDIGGDLALGAPDHGSACRFGRGIPLPFPLLLELDDARFAGADAFTERLDVQARAHLAFSRGFERGEHPIARRRVQNRSRGLECDRELLLGDPRGSLGVRHGSLSLRDARGEAVALGDRSLVAHGRAVDLLSVGRRGGVVGPQRLERGPGRLPSGVESAHAVGKCFAERVGDDHDLGEPVGRGVAFGSQFQARPALTRPRPHRLRGHDLSRPRHHRGSGVTGEERLRRREVIHDHDVAEEGEDAVRCLHDVARRNRARDAGDRLRSLVGRGDRDVDDPEIASPHRPGHGERVVARVDEHALGERAEDSRDGCLIARGHLDRIADESPDAGPSARDDLGRCVAHIQRATERLRLRGQGVQLPLRGVEALAQSAHGGLGIRRLPLRSLVGGRVLGGRLLGHEIGVDAGEDLLGLEPPLLGGVQRPLLAIDGGADSREGGCGGLRCAAQRGDAHVVLRHERALGRDVGVERIEFGTRAHDVASRLGGGILCISQPARDLVDLCADLVDHGLRDGGEG